MKTWIRRTLLGVFAGSLLFGGLAACSHQRTWPTSEADAVQWRDRMVERATDKLKLDVAQKDKLVALTEAIKAQRGALVTGASPREEFKAVITGSQFDRARAQSLLDGKLGAVRDQGPKVLDAMAAFFDSLNAEQQQQVREFLARGRGHRPWG